MKSIKKIFITTAVVSLLATSCRQEYLETSPSTALGVKDAEKTEQGLQAIVQGMHNMMYNYSFSNNGYGQHSLNAQYDMLGNDMINTKPAYFMSIYRWQEHTNPNSNGLNYKAWDFYYTVIQHANTVIGNVDKISMSANSKAQIKGEAYAFRAWAYHNLVQLFGKRYEKGKTNSQLGVIIRTPDNMLDKLPRSTVEEVYTLIDSDLKIALENLSNAKDTGEKNSIRYSTACGIAARVALTKSDWANAVKYADLAIQKSGASLQKGDKLTDGFNNYGASEWMWGYTQNPTQDLKWSSFNANYSYNFNGDNKGLKFSVNRNIFDKMGKKDARRNWWVIYDISTGKIQGGAQIPSDAYAEYFKGGDTQPQWEITGQSIKFKSASATSTMGDALLMRLAEMYYIKAEAEARGGIGNAAATLNTIMITRDPDYNTTLSGDALIEEIMRNKRLDLWMEGQRFFDMKRLGEVPNRSGAKNFDYLPASDKSKAIQRNSGINAVKIATTPDSKYWQFAIPYQEIVGNPLCQQNEL